MRYGSAQHFVVGADGVPRTFWRWALDRAYPSQILMREDLERLVNERVVRAWAAHRYRGVTTWSVLGNDERRRDFETLADLRTWLDGVDYQRRQYHHGQA